MWDGFNKRKFPRLALNCEIAIQSETSSAPVSAVTENLGIGGLCVILSQQLERFSKCRLRLDLGEKTPVECDARVVWIVPTQGTTPSKKHFDTGLEFVGLEPEAVARVRAYIESELKKNPAKSVPV